MVFPAVLRDPPLDPGQAPRRHRALRRHRGPRLRALARYVAGALRDLPPALPPVLLDLRGRRDPARLSRLAAAGRRLCRPLAHLHGLLLHPLPHHPAGDRTDRAAETAARLDYRVGAGEGRHSRSRRGEGLGPMTRVRLFLALAFAIGAVTPLAAEEAPAAANPTSFPLKEPEPQRWPFAGFFGRYDQAQLQRGFQVYKEVCSNCHSLKLVAFRHLAEE